MNVIVLNYRLIEWSNKKNTLIYLIRYLDILDKKCFSKSSQIKKYGFDIFQRGGIMAQIIWSTRRLVKILLGIQ